MTHLTAAIIATLILVSAYRLAAWVFRHDCQYGPPTGRCMSCGASPEAAR